MRPKKHEATGEGDLFRARLDQIINMKHELVQLAAKIEWAWIDGEIVPLYSDKGRPGIESRFVIGLLLLKHMFGLSRRRRVRALGRSPSTSPSQPTPSCCMRRSRGSIAWLATMARGCGNPICASPSRRR